MNTKHTFVVCAYKESEYLEECITSLLAQTVKSKIIVVTSTPNDYIQNLVKKYKLKENLGLSRIGTLDTQKPRHHILPLLIRMMYMKQGMWNRF